VPPRETLSVLTRQKLVERRKEMQISLSISISWKVLPSKYRFVTELENTKNLTFEIPYKVYVLSVFSHTNNNCEVTGRGRTKVTKDKST
jgi:hypothetical protein